MLRVDHSSESAMPDQIKTRFLLLSDTHARAPHPATATAYPCRWPLPKADVAIHTGDLTMNGNIDDNKQAFNLLKDLNAGLKIVIPGNHDLTLDTAYYANNAHVHGPWPKCTAEDLEYIRNLYTGPEAAAANIIYLEEGTKTFRLDNGARLTIYASAYTPEFCQWAFAYPRDQDRFNPPNAENPIPDYEPGTDSNVDIVLTHGPPLGILDKVRDRLKGGNMYVGCEHLYRAVERARPLLHCFGHIHEGWGAVRKTWPKVSNPGRPTAVQTPARQCSPVAVDERITAAQMGAYVNCTGFERGKETLFVNSSIMDLRYNARQGPWSVDLMLDKAR